MPEIREFACWDGPEEAPLVRKWVPLDEYEQLRGNLSLAEEGLANYALEVGRLQKKLLEDMATIQSQGDEIERLRNDIQELTCGDPRLVCPNCRPSSGHPTGDG